MMAKLGFKAGQSLGKAPSDESTNKDNTAQHQTSHRSEPLNLVFKEDRGGIGLDNEKKRKIREEAEEASKKIKQDEGDYRDRVREERETRRTEAQFRAAQKVAERLDTEESQPNPDKNESDQKEGQNEDRDQSNDHKNNESASSNPAKQKQKQQYKPTSQINILYRGLIREREEKDRTIQARHILQSSLPSSFFPKARLPGFSENEYSLNDQTALGQRDSVDLEPYTSAVEQEIEEEDPELDAFNELPASERLMKIVLYLRERFRYCFWCKFRYENDQEFEGCPGITEEDHD